MLRQLRLEALPDYPPGIGQWLWALEEVRSRTLRAVEGLEQAELDWTGEDGAENSIGSLLYHIAVVEISWLYFDCLNRPAPEHVQAVLPHELVVGDRLTHVPGEALGLHLARLHLTRRQFLDEVRRMSLADWELLRHPPGENYEVTPGWAVFHLVEHEAAHTGQILALKPRAIRATAGGV